MQISKWLIFLATCASVGACGLVTGLSDDYRFDATDASAPAPGDGGSDARGTEAGSDANVCSADSAKQALGDTTGVSSTCLGCLTTTCCAAIATCAGSAACKHGMTCVMACQSKQGGDRSSCLNDCDGQGGRLFTDAVASCLQSCPSGANTCRLR